jgi:hypothetical protein
MDTALIGFVGVIAGALVTGGVQGVLAWNGRLLEARASAKLIYGTLFEMAACLTGIEEADALPEGAIRWLPNISAWEQSRSALARVVGPEDFHTVARAFANFAADRVTIEEMFEETSGQDVDGARLVLLKKDCAVTKNATLAAEKIAWKAGYRRFSRKGRSSPVESALAELAADRAGGTVKPDAD